MKSPDFMEEPCIHGHISPPECLTCVILERDTLSEEVRRLSEKIRGADYKGHAAVVEADRAALDLSPLPNPVYGDIKAYCRLAHLTLSVWSDLIRLKGSVHEDYQKCLQMDGESRKAMMDLVLKTDAILTYAFAAF